MGFYFFSYGIQFRTKKFIDCEQDQLVLRREIRVLSSKPAFPHHASVYFWFCSALYPFIGTSRIRKPKFPLYYFFKTFLTHSPTRNPQISCVWYASLQKSNLPQRLLLLLPQTSATSSTLSCESHESFFQHQCLPFHLQQIFYFQGHHHYMFLSWFGYCTI